MMRLLKLATLPLVLLAVALGIARTEAAPLFLSFAPGSEAQVVAEAQTPAAPDPAELAPPAPSAPAPLTPAVAELRADLTQVLATANRGAQVGVLVVSLERGDTLFAFNPDALLAPASNMKLFSTAAALYYLGPEFRYTTYVLGTGELTDGVLHGDLILYGTGDPTMSRRMLSGSVTPLRELADTLRARGVREVRGDVVGDGSYFDAEWLGRGWSSDNFGAWYSAPVGALSVAENVASVRVLPAPTPGAPARITTVPATQGLSIVNRTTTIPSGQTSIRFDHQPTGLVVSGRIARNHPGIERSMPIVDPTDFTAAVFRRVLEEQGVQVHGGVRTVHEAEHSPVSLANHSARNGNPHPHPHPRVLAIHLSPRMAEMVSVTNHVSHNLFAEALLKTVGRVALGEGSFDGGARAIRYFLECEAGIDSTAVAIVDGSGLSPLNRVSARGTIQLLDLMTRSEHWETFLSSLPEAGHRRPRGLQRMHGSAAERNLRAKTGTIRTVSSLSGYVRSADGELLAFSILANNLPASTWGQKRLEDQIGVRLAEFQRPVMLATTAETATPEPRAGELDLHDAPDEPQPTAAPAEPREPRQERTHTVRAGDTLDGIARRHGTTVRAIEAANPGINPRRIRPGQSIRLPD
jgi:serine-type D-Ala-D-Ala carboxypeptidase/endopeptidase (penicillin-binding protein 4)